MAVEIERKFLVKNDTWKTNEQGEAICGSVFRQGYLSEGEATVRVRLEGAKGKLTIKGRNQGMSRLEYEYDIPADEAAEMLARLCAKPLIEKTRFVRQEGQHTWEIDVFEGDNAGLVVAEVELSAEDEHVELPHWIGEEVTSDPRYYNVNLAKTPVKDW